MAQVERVEQYALDCMALLTTARERGGEDRPVGMVVGMVVVWDSCGEHEVGMVGWDWWGGNVVVVVGLLLARMICCSMRGRSTLCLC